MSTIVKFNNKVLRLNNKTVGWTAPPDPFNPLDLPVNTVRVRTNDGNAPIKYSIAGASYDTATLVPGTTDVYDVYKSGDSFRNLLMKSTNVVEVLGANTYGITSMYSMFNQCNNLSSVPLFDTSIVTDMYGMFNECTSLTSVPLYNTSNVTDMRSMFNTCYRLSSVPLFDTSKVTSMYSMFAECNSLTAIPLFDTSKVTNMGSMFSNCKKVEAGALALYQQASSQTTPPANHTLTFRNCGVSSQQGSVELAQIPDDWK